MTSRTFRAAALSVAVVTALDVAAAYQLGIRAEQAPAFRRGGAFAVAAGSGVDERPVPYGVSSTAPSSSTVPPPGHPTTSTSALPSPVHAAAAPTTASTAMPRVASPAAAEIVVPAPGTYTYAVTGSERVTGFGSRDLPEEATLTIAPGESPSQRVLDLRLSGQHEERVITEHTGDGVSYVFEAGSVTFGPYTQTSEADYAPPMLQVPWPLQVGDVRTGATEATDADGNVTRVEDWKVTVEGTERVGDLDTVVVLVERQSRPGGTESVSRTKRWWYAPALGTFVRWHETMHAERNMVGSTFTFDIDYEAVLRDVRA